jgi:hypothetical protein
VKKVAPGRRPVARGVRLGSRDEPLMLQPPSSLACSGRFGLIDYARKPNSAAHGGPTRRRRLLRNGQIRPLLATGRGAPWESITRRWTGDRATAPAASPARPAAKGAGGRTRAGPTAWRRRCGVEWRDRIVGVRRTRKVRRRGKPRVPRRPAGAWIRTRGDRITNPFQPFFLTRQASHLTMGHSGLVPVRRIVGSNRREPDLPPLSAPPRRKR